MRYSTMPLSEPAQPAQPMEEPKAIPRELKRLDEKITNLEAIAQELVERLRPALRPTESVPPDNAAEVVERDKGQIATAIDESTFRVSSLTLLVAGLLRDLEI